MRALPGPSRPVVGLDLAGSPRRRTGFCRLGPGLTVATRVLFDDAEILDAVRRARPALVGIDAPLSLPRGRASLEAVGPPHFRACDRALRALGIPFFPLTLGPMRQLTGRGMALAQDVLGLPRKGDGERRLQRALRAFGFRGDVARRPLTHDELDAILCGYTSQEHLAGRSLVLGTADEGELVLPRGPARRRRARRRTGSA